MTASSKVSPTDRGFRVGDNVGRFLVKQVINQSPQAATYLVEHAVLGYPATARVYPSECAPDPRVACLSSPHIPAVFERGEIEGRLSSTFVVEEFISGPTLAQVLRLCRRLQVNVAVKMAVQLLSALAEAHKYSIAHGSVRPENILVADEYAACCERFVLINFGDAKAGAPPASGVMSRTLATSPYVAPELRQGSLPKPSSDIFALGCVLFEAITGECPEWDDAGRLLKQVAEIVPSHPDTSRIIAKAIALDPKARFESAQDMATVLLAVDADELSMFGVGETTQLHGPAETVDTVDMTRPRADLTLPESLRGLTIQRGKPTLLSTAKPHVWFFSGDPGLDTPQVKRVIARLAEKFDVHVLDALQREQRQGAVSDAELPWVVVFGDLHALVDEPLLRQLSARGETARVLVSTHDNVDMLSSTVNATGLDAQACVSEDTEQLVGIVESMIERVRTTRIQYDGLRLAVADAVVDVERLQQCFERKSA